MRPSLIQTPVVWPPSNVPQGWAQFGAYHYPTQSRMHAPLALISPYTPVCNYSISLQFCAKHCISLPKIAYNFQAFYKCTQDTYMQSRIFSITMLLRAVYQVKMDALIYRSSVLHRKRKRTLKIVSYNTQQ